MEKNFSLDLPILDCKGQLLQVGRSFDGLPAFSRSDLSFFAREILFCGSDRYYFGNDEIKLCVEVFDCGLFGFSKVTMFTAPKGELIERTASRIVPLSLGSFSMPDDPNYGDTILRLKDFSIDLLRSPGKRYVRCHIDAFDDVRSLYINVALNESSGDKMYCSHKLPANGCRLAHRRFAMRCEGQVVCGAETYRILPENSFGMLDWERGIFKKLPPYCLMQADCELDGEPMSFCFSSGICPDGVINENVVNIGGASFEPGDVQLSVDARDYYRPWKMRSADKRCEFLFSPTKVFGQELIKKPLGINRIFALGHYSGSFRLNNGRTVAFENIFGFAECLPERQTDTD